MAGRRLKYAELLAEVIVLRTENARLRAHRTASRETTRYIGIAPEIRAEFFAATGKRSATPNEIAEWQAARL